MAKKRDRNRVGPRVIPAHWQTPQTTGTAPTAPASAEGPAGWAMGPCWASRIDGSGSQGVFLSRQRPWGGSLTVVGAVVSDAKGMSDAMGDHAIGQTRMEERIAEAAGPGHRVYRVPPEYVRFRARQGEELSQPGGQALPAPFRRYRHLLEGVDPDWTPDFATLEQERHRPDLLEQTGVLLSAMEFSDWRPAAEDNPAVKDFLDAVDGALAGLPDDGKLENPEDFVPPSDLELLDETHILTAPWPLTEEATQQVESLIDEHLEKVLTRETADRYRDRLLHMAYLTGLAAQPNFSSLIATAAWGLSPERDTPLAQHPFLRALLRKAVEHHVMGMETE